MAKAKVVKSVGKTVSKGRKGQKLIRKRLADAGLDATRKNLDDYTKQLAADIDASILKKTTNFDRKLVTAAGKESPSSFAKVVGNIGEESNKMATEIAEELGDLGLVDDLSKALSSKFTKMAKASTKKSARSVIGKSADELVEVGATDEVVDAATVGFSRKLLNGTVATAKKYPRLSTGFVVIAGVGVLMWSGTMDIFTGTAGVLERFGILPKGATAKVVAFWGRMRGFITLVIWIVLGYVVYKIMNVIFVGTKAVGSGLDSVADAIAPEEPEPAGA
tara:strand:- start:4601 stop:5431 length:831 start_codon:yes stop_codon:yes gene_type:complete